MNEVADTISIFHQPRKMRACTLEAHANILEKENEMLTDRAKYLSDELKAEHKRYSDAEQRSAHNLIRAQQAEKRAQQAEKELEAIKKEDAESQRIWSLCCNDLQNAVPDSFRRQDGEWAWQRAVRYIRRLELEVNQSRGMTTPPSMSGPVEADNHDPSVKQIVASILAVFEDGAFGVACKILPAHLEPKARLAAFDLSKLGYRNELRQLGHGYLDLTAYAKGR